MCIHNQQIYLILLLWGKIDYSCIVRLVCSCIEGFDYSPLSFDLIISFSLVACFDMFLFTYIALPLNIISLEYICFQCDTSRLVREQSSTPCGWSYSIQLLYKNISLDMNEYFLM